MKFCLFCLSWSLAHKAACMLFCIQHFFLPFFFSHFQKDLFLRTDEPHTEKMNRPDCLVLRTHRWRQIFRRTQFPRRHLNKWQILRSRNVPTSFGAQLVLELLWKNLLWYGCSPSLMPQDFHISSLVLYLGLSAMLTLMPFSIPQVSAELPLVAMSLCTIKRSACIYTHISVKGPSCYCPQIQNICAT